MEMELGYGSYQGHTSVRIICKHNISENNDKKRDCKEVLDTTRKSTLKFVTIDKIMRAKCCKFPTW